MKRHGKIFIIFVVLFAFIIATVAQVSAAPTEKTRVWVEYAPGKAAAVSGYLRQVGAQFHYHFGELDSFVVSLPDTAIKGIANNPNVIYIEEDAPRYLVKNLNSEVEQKFVADTTEPNGQTIPFGIDMVQARDIWDADRDGAIDPGSPTGEGRTVCIIDTGYLRDHEDLVMLSDESGVAQPDPPWWNDMNGHGSHVAGTISAMNNDVGVVGVSPGTVGLFIVKIFGNDGLWVSKAHTSDLVEAAFYCRDLGDADVISMSLSGTTKQKKEKDAFDLLYSQGILSIGAASNEGIDEYHYPASYDSVVSVAAIDESGTVANFSQFNDQVELAAPGVHVLSTIPYLDIGTLTVSGITYEGAWMEFSGITDPNSITGELVYGGLCGEPGIPENWGGKVVVCQRGDYTFLEKVQNVMAGDGIAAVIYNNLEGLNSGTLVEELPGVIPAITLSKADGEKVVAEYLGMEGEIYTYYEWPYSYGYAHYDGTSMATPHVSGVAALVWSANPDWSNVEIRNALQQTAVDLGDPGRDVHYGYGLVQAADALAYLEGTVNEEAINVDLKIGKKVFNSGDLVSIEVTVGTMNIPLAGASVRSLITTANGNQIGSLLTTDGNGKATITYRATFGRDGVGTYTVDVTASLDGYDPGSATTTFKVKK
jgi:serine protease